ncbi:MAG TPA: UDP-N-acetylmuramoyl-L-alanyl-D-glutamate--2,6-diaminopimelate ligase [Rickettsiales bacterium]|nr:UDP-N-acetylmuramoyl-L-alanyl-D-glutamate--2,6-diaminopimelate ligase [Rickettsiales bacterium]
MINIVFIDLIKDEKELTEQIKNNKFFNYEIDEIKVDSRHINPNDIFVAVKGYMVDASKFIPDVMKAGAKIILCDSDCEYIPTDLSDDVLVLKSKNLKELLGRLLNKLYPNKPKHILGVTGTNGKTSVAELTKQCIGQLGISVASIGSLGVRYILSDGTEGEVKYKHSLTNPDLIEFHKYLSWLKTEKNVDYVITEATSQGMRNGRLDGVEFDTGAYTNITRDHIGDSPSLHKTFDDYFDCKMLLFKKYLKKDGYAIINADVPEFDKVLKVAEKEGQKIFDYGFNAKAIKIKDIKSTNYGQDITLELFGKEEFKVKLGIIGKVQAYNICCVVGSLIGLGFKDRLKEVDFMKIKSANGRGDLIAELKNGAKIFLDYPTTEDALRSTIITFKEYQSGRGSKGRVIILFGAGGDRDPLKRPRMGKIATDLADLAIITEDSPRTENPAKIRKDIMEGCDKSKAINIGNDKVGETIEGRARALKYAISILEEDDILITNKGHETYIEINGKEEDYPEREFIKKFVEERNKILDLL